MNDYPYAETSRKRKARSFSKTPKRRSFFKQLIAGLTGIILVLAAVVGVLQYFGIYLLRQPITPSTSLAAPTSFYLAPVPGVHCDQGNAQWTDDDSTHTSCANGRMILTASKPGQEFGQELFRMPTGVIFPSRYRILVDISNFPSGICAGIQYQLSNFSDGHYSFSVCQDGSWYLDLVDRSGLHTAQLSPEGSHVDQASVYHLSLAFVGGTQAAMINGLALPLVTDTRASDGNYITLYALAPTGVSLHAEFANFEFDRL